LRQRLGARATERVDVLIGVHPDWRVNVPRRPPKFVHIPNIVDDLFFQASRHPEPGRVLYCGGPKSIKGWDILSEAWPLVAEREPGARLEALGFQPDHRFAQRNDAIGSIELCGWLSARGTREAMERAAVLVMPSRFEVAPMVLAEAWASGVPIVATAVGGIPALARGAAVLVRPSHAASLAAAIANVLQGGRIVCRLVEEGRSRAEAYRRDQVVEDHLHLYLDLCES
jgi:glycosyltransferase involved in cell wall biosynthesis